MKAACADYSNAGAEDKREAVVMERQVSTDKKTDERMRACGPVAAFREGGRRHGRFEMTVAFWVVTPRGARILRCGLARPIQRGRANSRAAGAGGAGQVGVPSACPRATMLQMNNLFYQWQNRADRMT